MSDETQMRCGAESYFRHGQECVLEAGHEGWHRTPRGVAFGTIIGRPTPPADGATDSEVRGG